MYFYSIAVLAVYFIFGAEFLAENDKAKEQKIQIKVYISLAILNGITFLVITILTIISYYTDNNAN